MKALPDLRRRLSDMRLQAMALHRTYTKELQAVREGRGIKGASQRSLLVRAAYQRGQIDLIETLLAELSREDTDEP